MPISLINFVTFFEHFQMFAGLIDKIDPKQGYRISRVDLYTYVDVEKFQFQNKYNISSN